MAISVPNVVKVTGIGVTSVTTSGVTTTTGSTFTLSTTADTGVTPSFSDSKGNSYANQIGSTQTLPTGAQQQVRYKESGTGGAGHTATVSYSASTYPVVFFSEVAGAATASYDSAATAQASSTSGSPFPVTSGTPAQANNAVLSWMACDAGGTLTYDATGFTVTYEADGNNFWTGAIGYKLITAAAAQTANWTVGASGGMRTIAVFKEASGGGGVSGTAAWTEANDTAAVTGSLSDAGSLAWTEANDTSAVTGALTASGSASWTEASDTASLTGSATVSGVASWTEASDSTSLAGSLTVSGPASWTESNDVAALSGSVGSSVGGALAWTEADDAAALTGSAKVSGASAWTESNDAYALAGQVTQPASGVIAWTEADDIAALAGTSAVNQVQLLGGGPGGPKKKRGDTESYLERLLGRPLVERIEPEEIDVIEQVAEEAAIAPEPPSKSDAAESLRAYGLALKEAYVEILLELEQKKRQQREESEMVSVIATLL